MNQSVHQQVTNYGHIIFKSCITDAFQDFFFFFKILLDGPPVNHKQCMNFFRVASEKSFMENDCLLLCFHLHTFILYTISILKVFFWVFNAANSSFLMESLRLRLNSPQAVLQHQRENLPPVSWSDRGC